MIRVSRALAGLVLVWSLLMSTSVMADEVDEVDDQLQSFAEQLDGLQEEAETFAPEAYDRTRVWLNEAKHIHGEGRSSGLEQRLRRVDHSLDLLRALVTTEELKASIESQKEAYDSSKRQVDSLREELETLEARKAERQRELEDIRSQLED